MKKRIFSIVISLCMVLALMPQMVFAESVTNIAYLDATGVQKNCDSAIVVASEDTTWGDDGNDGWYVVQGNVLISSITVNGDVHLILADGCSLTVNGNISGGSLNIYGQYGGTGKLAVSGSIISGNGVDADDDDPGSVGGDGSSITINGGVVEAGSITGGTGGYASYTRGGIGGSIIINGGVIDAGSITGGNGGGNMLDGTGGDGGNISIRNGMVKTDNITGGNGGDGGDYENSNVYGGNGGNVTISGHIVEAGNINSGSGGGYGIKQGPNPSASGVNGNNGNTIIDGGIVFQGDSGQVYGTSFTLSEALTIPAGKTLTISDDKTLKNNGIIYVDGTLTGSVDSSSTGSIYYLLTLEGATASGFDSTYNEKTYAKAGSEITLTPGTPSTTGYGFDSWEVSDRSVTIGENNKFTMPAAALTVTARYKDIEKPVISGVEDGKTYCSAQTVTVSDNDAIEKVTVNGTEVTLDEYNQFTLSPATGEQEIIATDKAGNRKAVTVTVNNGHTYGEWQSNGDGTHTRYCTVTGCNGYEDGECTGGQATCTSKAICEYCGEEYGELDSTNHNLEKISAKDATVTATGNKEYWHCKDCGKYFADENGTKEIKLEDTIISKLSPEIIEGKGQSIAAGEKKELTFKSNAAFSDFIRVELDGKTLDEKYYTVKEGSTIVTLKADYVATLSAGEHTIGIVSTNGTATTTFTVNAKAVVDNDTKSPQTGDNSHMALWIALLFVSGAGVIGTTVYGKKKRAK